MDVIVVDLGCMTHGDEESLFRLRARFNPTRLYGFDPLLPGDDEFVVRGTRVTLRRCAAWTHDGETPLGFGARGMDSTVVAEKNLIGEWDLEQLVPCIDFSSWLLGLGQRVVLKMDIEGAEYQLLSKMIEDGSAALVDLLLVEWHDHWIPGFNEGEQRSQLLGHLPCLVEGW